MISRCRTWLEYFARQWGNDASRYTGRERFVFAWRMAWCATFVKHGQRDSMVLRPLWESLCFGFTARFRSERGS